MALFNVKLKDENGNYLYPKTLGSLVVDSNDNQWAEQGAQVNVLEGVTVNSTDLTISQKKAQLTFTIQAKSTPNQGFASSYQLLINGTAVGDDINIPRGMVLQSGSLQTVQTADTPYSGAVVGDKYIDLVLNTTPAQHIYIPVNDLVDNYTAGLGLELTSGAFSVKIPATETNLVADATGLHLSPTATAALQSAAQGITYEVIV